VATPLLTQVKLDEEISRPTRRHAAPRVPIPSAIFKLPT